MKDIAAGLVLLCLAILWLGLSTVSDFSRLKTLRKHIIQTEKYEPCSPTNDEYFDDAMGVDCTAVNRARSGK